MVGSKKEKAIQLLQAGKSYREISCLLDIAKSTLNNWFAKLPEKEKITIKKFRINNWHKNIEKFHKIRRRQTLSKEDEIRGRAAKQIPNFFKKELFLAGICLYWAEGGKSNRWQLQFTNSDPDMIKLMMKFFREIYRVSEKDFYLQMILHKNIKENKALNYWAKITQITKRQFKKACYSQSKSSRGIRNKRQLPFGTLQIRILDKKLTQTMYGHIQGLKIEIAKTWRLCQPKLQSRKRACPPKL